MRQVRSKTGCRTCKIRKLKCDEERPSCQRCRTAGWTCDGYGIWDRPGDRKPAHANVSAVSKRRLPSSLSALPPSTAAERAALEWFVHRTVAKLPGSFVSPFWTRLILQAGFSETAVFHAILCLATIHRELGAAWHEKPADTALTRTGAKWPHRITAWKQLRSRFEASDQASVRVILISCALFTYSALLLSEFAQALMHLQEGLNILEKAYSPATRNGDLTPADEWIIDVFQRLDFMHRLFKFPSHRRCGHRKIRLLVQDKAVPTIASFKDAWAGLQKLLNRIFDLSDRVRSQAERQSQHQAQPATTDLKTQRDILSELDNWSSAFNTFHETNRHHIVADTKKVYHTMLAYCDMASIMASAALRPRDELVYDPLTPRFTSLLEHLCCARIVAALVYSQSDPLDGPLRMDRSIIDLGWIPPLYFTATKCRIHHIRMQAIEMLGGSLHREGLWDAKLMSCVARKAVQLEEQGFCLGNSSANRSSSGEHVVANEKMWPTLPRSHRCSDIEVVLSGSPVDEIHLSYTRPSHDQTRKRFKSVYSTQSGTWKDCSESERPASSVNRLNGRRGSASISAIR